MIRDAGSLSRRVCWSGDQTCPAARSSSPRRTWQMSRFPAPPGRVGGIGELVRRQVRRSGEQSLKLGMLGPALEGLGKIGRTHSRHAQLAKGRPQRLSPSAAARPSRGSRPAPCLAVEQQPCDQGRADLVGRSRCHARPGTAPRSAGEVERRGEGDRPARPSSARRSPGCPSALRARAPTLRGCAGAAERGKLTQEGIRVSPRNAEGEELDLTVSARSLSWLVVARTVGSLRLDALARRSEVASFEHVSEGPSHLAGSPRAEEWV